MVKTKPLKILFYIESLRCGGKERRLVELIKGLRKYPDIEMELVLTKDEIHYTDIIDTNIKIHYTIRKRLTKDPRVFFQFYKITKNFMPDIIHVWGGMVAVYAIPSAKYFKIKLINGSITYAAHVKVLSKIWIYSKLTFPLSNIIVSNSIAGLRTHKLAQSKKNRIIYNGYDFNRNNVKSTNLKKELILSDNSLLVGMIGSFSDAKDYTTYIKMAEIISAKINNIVFLCIGDGENRRKIEAIVYERKINNIYFLGTRSDIESICKELDIGVLLTNTNGHAEGISNVIMEMMASGLLVIATNAGGTPELIKNQIDGILVEPYDINQIVNEISNLINNKYKINKMGCEAKRKIKHQFCVEKMINNYYELYKENIL